MCYYFTFTFYLFLTSAFSVSSMLSLHLFPLPILFFSSNTIMYNRSVLSLLIHILYFWSSTWHFHPIVYCFAHPLAHHYFTKLHYIIFLRPSQCIYRGLSRLVIVPMIKILLGSKYQALLIILHQLSYGLFSSDSMYFHHGALDIEIWLMIIKTLLCDWNVAGDWKPYRKAPLTPKMWFLTTLARILRYACYHE